MTATLLVANRGEIACRILRSARDLGLRTVAVHSDADRGARHVRLADDAVRLGPAPVAESYDDGGRLLDAALAAGADVLHPGYGFRSEDAAFAGAVEAAGVAFAGPTPGQLRVLGDKARARALAEECGLRVLPGSPVLAGLEDANGWAREIGFPLVLKDAGGGGGTGVHVCRDPGELAAAWHRESSRPGTSGRLYVERHVERARHLEVQLFGDGAGRVVTLGDRDCSVQRRHQKVLEVAPAPHLDPASRTALHDGARRLAERVALRSAATLEALLDADTGDVTFLEVNPRIQVEHTVTEEVTGVDLVAWMLRLALGDTSMLEGVPASGPALRGAAVQARVYVEDVRHGRPVAGTLARLDLPSGHRSRDGGARRAPVGRADGTPAGRARATVRVETGASVGDELGPHADPLLAKVVVRASTHAGALGDLRKALRDVRVDGVPTNVSLLRAALDDPAVAAGTATTTTLGRVHDPSPSIEVLDPGVLTTVQDWPGRTGYWAVGVPPSGPMDDLSFRAGNRALGNPEGLPGLEATLTGPTLRFTHAATVCVTGAPAPVTVDGEPVRQWEPVEVPPGGVLAVGGPHAVGLRTYVLVRGGLDVPTYLGSSATFLLGGIGGYAGRALATGDVLHPRSSRVGSSEESPAPRPVPSDERPRMGHSWEIAVATGPQPTHLTTAALGRLRTSWWRVLPHADRTGVRLSGPPLTWVRADGADAGLHPSNVHDNPYSVGALNVSGDTPILLGPDGPSLGGFVCPLTVVAGARWKLGQLRPGDVVRFVVVDDDAARVLRTRAAARAAARVPASRRTVPDDGVLARRDGDGPVGRPVVRYLRGAEDNALVEYDDDGAGDPLLLRLRVHALAQALAESAPRGVVDVTPGVRTLHVHVDPDELPARRLVGLLEEIEGDLPPSAEIEVPSRELRLPLSWDDPAIHEAVERYAAAVREDAPWLPSNADFVRRVNGLGSVDDVRRTVLDAQYLVLGLGDVYLGAPLALPVDPRHRLLTTKYTPARTWTPADAVGLGGTYLCVYGMDSPGGYQLVGRTVPIWAPHAQRDPFERGVPWLFRAFDRIVWEPVDAAELVERRAAARAGVLDVPVSPGTFSGRAHLDLLATHADEIASVTRSRRAAFDRELEAWAGAGELVGAPGRRARRSRDDTGGRWSRDRTSDGDPGIGAAARGPGDDPRVPGADEEHDPDRTVLRAPIGGVVWRLEARPGDRVPAGGAVVVLEAMKLELPVTTALPGRVTEVLVRPGDHVAPGDALAVVVTVA
ncbi:5-oxoprolinase/urea amidolyase family protein [Cellulosimicrobium sp. PMB13]|uniref:5-oxoprolinase/urea amidolyase family protein n=1 Tax=Cellulosimicrobium sp. PMB13 TaxID=3120158 RepID=UPI003F4C4A1F